MGVPTQVVGEIYRCLERIKVLAKEVEDIPNFGPDMWSMKEGDKKCQEIWQRADWISKQISQYVGTGKA